MCFFTTTIVSTAMLPVLQKTEILYVFPIHTTNCYLAALIGMSFYCWPAYFPVPWQHKGARGFLLTQTISSWMKSDVSDLGPIIYDTVTSRFLERVPEKFFQSLLE